MPERPPPFDFKALKPDVPVEFTLLKESFSGRKEGADYDWHAYPCSYAGNEVMVFTPSERVHAALQYLKVLPKTKFTITKGSDINLDSGKSFVFYTITHGDQTVDTKNELTNGTEEAEGALKDTPYIKEPKVEVPTGLVGLAHTKQFQGHYTKIMDIKLEYLADWLPWADLKNTEKLQVLCALDKSTSRNVTSILIGQEKNGGRK